MAIYKRECPRCGKPFTSESVRQKWCGATCRVESSNERAALRARGEDATVIAGNFAPDNTETKPTPRKKRQAKVLTAVIKSLTDHDQLETVAGQQAVALAERIENSITDTGSAYAALSKELDRVMDVALANVTVADALDDMHAKVLEFRGRRSG